MIHGKNNSPGSAVGPIIVMIDASRLSHTLATALKDRPHGIPVQPNRSLPLRPPPPLPVRIPIAKSQKNTPITRGNTTSEATQRSGNSDKRSSFHREDDTNDALPGLERVGMNFYDSKDKVEHSNNNFVESVARRKFKELAKPRQTKSLDDEATDESSCNVKRRKSFGYETIRRIVDGKKKYITNFDWAKSRSKVTRDKKGPESRAKKRKSSNAEENLDVSRKTKSPKVRNFDAGTCSAKFKTSSSIETTEPSTKSMNLDAVESSGRGLPTIFKYRNSPSTSPQLTDRNVNFNASDVGDQSNWKQTSSNTFKLILPKPQSIPKCPVAIPIEHTINQGESRNLKINPEANDAGVAKSRMSNLEPTMNQFDSMKPNINLRAMKAHIPEMVEDIENTLPSMPSLEDLLLTESLHDIRKNQVDVEDVERNADKASMPIVQAKVLQIPSHLASKTSDLFDNEPIQGNINGINDHKLNQPHAKKSIVNLTTVLKIQIPGRSPEVILLTAPHIMADGKVDSVANNSPIQIKTPGALSSGIQPALDEPKKIEEITNIDTISGLRELGKESHQESPSLRKSCINLVKKALEEENRTEISSADIFLSPNDNQQQCQDLSGKDQPQYMLQHKSPVEFEVRIRDTCSEPQTEEPQKYREDEPVGEKPQEIAKDSQARSKVDESIVRCRINRLNLKLKKLYEEESHLKFKMSQSSDASRLTRLQQRLNCAEKKIENTQKYLNKLISIENPSLYANPGPSRIQVRRDLVQPIPSPKSVEPAPQSPLRPTDKTNMISTGRSPTVSPPVIITLSETDSASSGEETYVNDGKSPDYIKPYFQSGVELKFPDQNVAENDSRVAYTADNPSPKVDTNADNDLNKLKSQDASVQPTPLNVNPKMTNINTEYLNNNLPPVCKGVPVSVINAPIIIPPMVRNQGNFSATNLDDYARQKSPSVQYAALNLTSTPDRFERQVGKPNFDCLPCTQNNAVVPANNTAEFDANNFVPSTVNDLHIPKTVSQTTASENTNVHPVPNYPVHRNDYRTTGNVPSMFSRENGGANINLSSPLQGHSALPLPPPYYRNLTAQGYSMPAEPSPNQTIRWHNQYPTKSSTQLTPDKDVSSHSSILAAHLLKSQPQEAANFNNSIKLSSLLQRTDTTQTNPAKHVSNRIITEQFPTLGNWAAQMTSESTTRHSGHNAIAPPSNTRPQVDLGYKTTGSDMYKMAATAIDARRPISPANLIHWPSGKPWSEQPRPTQGLPGQRNNAHFYRREYPPNLRNPQNSHKPLPPYPGSEIFVPRSIPPYHQVPSGHQTTRNTEQSNNHSSQSQRNPRQYHPQTSLNRPLVARAYQYQGSSGQLVNTMPMPSQQYLSQASPYVPPMIPQWHAGNSYHKNYMNQQFNGYNIQTNPADNSMGYRPAIKNHASMQPNHQTMSRQLMQNISKIKLPSPIYNMSAALNSGVQDERSAEPLDLGRSCAAPHLGKVHKSLDRSNALQCSLCGMTGPRFNCNGCETAFYCNEHCQAQHWSTHYLECPKKMPKLKKVELKS